MTDERREPIAPARGPARHEILRCTLQRADEGPHSGPDAGQDSDQVITHTLAFAASTTAAAAAGALREIGYSGCLSAEILPLPDSETAAQRTMESIRRLSIGP